MLKDLLCLDIFCLLRLIYLTAPLSCKYKSLALEYQNRVKLCDQVEVLSVTLYNIIISGIFKYFTISTRMQIAAAR
jgi:hypothetical protein